MEKNREQSGWFPGNAHFFVAAVVTQMSVIGLFRRTRMHAFLFLRIGKVETIAKEPRERRAGERASHDSQCDAVICTASFTRRAIVPYPSYLILFL